MSRKSKIGKNILVEYRYAERKNNVAELSWSKSGQGDQVTIGNRQVGVADPIGTGLVLSLARPSGNATGLTPVSAQLNAKRLELLNETVPRVSRIAILSTPDYPLPVKTETLKEMEVAARALEVQLQLLEVRGPTISTIHSER